MKVRSGIWPMDSLAILYMGKKGEPSRFRCGSCDWCFHALFVFIDCLLFFWFRLSAEVSVLCPLRPFAATKGWEILSCSWFRCCSYDWCFHNYYFKLFCYDFCWYKDAIELEATRMSYAENYVKFQEAMKIMAQRCNLWCKRCFIR